MGEELMSVMREFCHATELRARKKFVILLALCQMV